jgi:hypothetical protein
VIELKRLWARMREQADIPDVRIHEARCRWLAPDPYRR